MGVVLPLRPQQDDMSLSDVWQMLDAWRDFMVARQYATDTIEDYESAYLRVIRRMRTSPRSMTEIVVERFLADTKVNGASRDLYLNAIKSVQRFAFKRTYSTVNPYEWDLPNGVVKYPPPDYFRVPELQAIMREAIRRGPPQRYWTIRLLLETGARIGSVAALEPRDVTEDRITFRVVKNDSPYAVMMTPAAAEAVAALASLMEPEQMTLVGRNKRTIGGWVHESATDAGLPPGRRHAHLLRHTAATMFHMRTKDLLLLQRFLGHRNLQTVHRYAAVVDAEMEAATARPLFEGETR